jgi:hypothetical protein
MRSKLTTAIAAAVAAALLVPAAAAAGASGTVSLAPAAAGSPTATASGEELVTYQTFGKLKLAKRVEYLIQCGAPVGQVCGFEVTNEIVLNGPNATLETSGGPFPSGQLVEVFIELNKGARNAIKASGKKAKVRSEVTATNLNTGEVDFDTGTFRFKR